MPKLPRIKAKDFIKVLNKLGFEEIRQKGSHKFFKHSDGRVTSVPFHARENIGVGLLRDILNQIQISTEELVKLLKK